MNIKSTIAICVLSLFSLFAISDESAECDELQTLSPENLEVFKTMPASSMLDVLEGMDRISASTFAIDNVSMEQYRELLLLKYTRASSTIANTDHRKQLIEELKNRIVNADFNAVDTEETQSKSRDLTDRLIAEFGQNYYFSHLRTLGHVLPEESAAGTCRCNFSQSCGFFSECSDTDCKRRSRGCGDDGRSECNGKCS